MHTCMVRFTIYHPTACESLAMGLETQVAKYISGSQIALTGQGPCPRRPQSRLRPVPAKISDHQLCVISPFVIFSGTSASRVT